MQYGTIIYMVALVAIFYFLIIRPQQQRQKQQQNTINSLAPRVKVTTYGGILGTVVKVKDDTVILQVAESTQIEVLKSAIARSEGTGS
ncbi:MAG: preprotein translocase subunit YajC [Thermincola sp.]|nr:preprotein translocase subunit YajC [Thermincola sp.]MDT3702666.1 preprotein translocase subunit YajC [Thermincola sp.]